MFETLPFINGTSSNWISYKNHPLADPVLLTFTEVTVLSLKVKVCLEAILVAIFPWAIVPTTDPFTETSTSLLALDNRTPTLDATTFKDETVKWLLLASPLPFIPLASRLPLKTPAADPEYTFPLVLLLHVVPLFGPFRSNFLGLHIPVWLSVYPVSYTHLTLPTIIRV